MTQCKQRRYTIILFRFQRKKSKKADDSLSDSSTTTPQPSQSLDLKPNIDELDHVFKKFDINGDTRSHPPNWVLFCPLSDMKPLTQMVREFDVDGDGFIDFKEFLEVNTHGVDTDEEVIENLKDAFDVEIYIYI